MHGRVRLALPALTSICVSLALLAPPALAEESAGVSSPLASSSLAPPTGVEEPATEPEPMGPPTGAEPEPAAAAAPECYLTNVLDCVPDYRDLVDPSPLMETINETVEFALRTAESCLEDDVSPCNQAQSMARDAADLATGAADNCLNDSYSVCRKAIATATGLANAGVQLALACASRETPACDNAVRTVQDAARDVQAVALACLNDDNSACQRTIVMVKDAADAAVTLVEAALGECLNNASGTCQQTIDTAGQLADGAVDASREAADECLNDDNSICQQAAALALWTAEQVLEAVQAAAEACLNDDNGFCQATLTLALQTANQAADDGAALADSATETASNLAEDPGLPDLSTDSPVCPDAGDQNCYANPIDRYDIGAEILYEEEGLLAIGPDPGTPTNLDNTNSFDRRRDIGNYAGIRFSGVSTTSQDGGIAGVDFALLQSNRNRGLPYLPCKNLRDPFQGACYTPGTPGYYRAKNYAPGASNPFPVGINVGNAGSVSGGTTCSGSCPHEWANRLFRIDPEFYPKRVVNGRRVTDFNYVRNRFAAVNNFTTAAPSDGVHTSVDYGAIVEKRMGDPGIVSAGGRVIDETGQSAVPKRVQFSIFEQGGAGRTTTGEPLQSFAAFDNTGGRYSTGALYTGRFSFKVIRKDSDGKIVGCQVTSILIDSVNKNLDIDLRRSDYGLGSGARAC